ncbi:iron-containing alcohol dehydrogenase [Clostridium sp. DL1XJH146]
MKNFNYSIPTEAFFGEGQVEVLPEKIKKYGSKVLLVYGGGSIKKIGLYSKIVKLFEDNNIYFEELSGVKANPLVSKVEEGIRIVREKKLDFILAVGGGSVIDSSKLIAAGNYYEGSPWDFCIGKAIIEKALPVGVVLTLAATGTEMNGNAVLSKEDEKRKLPAKSPLIKPKFAVLDPTLTYSVSKYQTAAGTIDIISHVFEQYFSPTKGTYLQDRMAEAIIKTCIHYAPIALNEQDNYEARANLMWSSTLALNELLSYGKITDWAVHSIEHEISGEYDITHGVGLAILIPNWMEYVLGYNTIDKFYEYAVNVWGISYEDKYKAANEAIAKTREFFVSLGVEKNLKELGIDDSEFEKIARNAVDYRQVGNFVVLDKKDIVEILKKSL